METPEGFDMLQSIRVELTWPVAFWKVSCRGLQCSCSSAPQEFLKRTIPWSFAKVKGSNHVLSWRMLGRLGSHEDET